MRFVTCRLPDGVEDPAILSPDGTQIWPLSWLGLSYETLSDAIPFLTPQVRAGLQLAIAGIPALPVDAVQLQSPIPCPAQDVVCLGINYMAHSDEAEKYSADAFATKHQDAIYFSKRVSRAVPDGGFIEAHTDLVQKLDYECELAVVLGKDARDVPAGQTKDYVFGYTILNDVSFTIPQGSFVSLVGESGCGKSTIAALLSGSRTGYTGSVTLGGVPVQELQQEQRLRTLTLVPHNAAIFKGTVESNLRMAKPDADEAQLWAALEQVNLADFCRSQNGLQTALHEGGSNLSGGQRQRLAMARALLHDTPIYLFDEATSNVDAESENDIMQAIHSLAGKKTIILISHRLANVVHSDCIYAMSNGRVIEQGTHAELLARQGAYSRLYLAQRQLETLEEEDA